MTTSELQQLILGCNWPHTLGDNKYIFTTEEGAKEIHCAIAAIIGKHSYCS